MKPPRRKFILPAKTREELALRADDLAAKLTEGDLTAGEAADLVSTVIGDALEMAAGMVGAPDKVADLVGKLAKTMATRVAEALKPDPDKLLTKATEAMRAGDFKKARRLMDRAERIQVRQEAPHGNPG